MPTGNLKISLNKRVAFPLSSAGLAQNSSQSASPLLLPPKPPSAVNEPPTSKIDESSTSSGEDLSAQKEKVLNILNAGVQELSVSVQSSTATKLKALEDDWSQCDIEVKRLLVEIAKCKK